ncbi:hypothetical protein DFH87_004233 [Clostridium saccharobutylicum]|nr:hypothetical protein [Clostridium saccharobutylicum]
MPIRINNINLSIDDEFEVLEKKICKKLKVSKDNINKIEIIKKVLMQERRMI